jgi:integrase
MGPLAVNAKPNQLESMATLIKRTGSPFYIAAFDVPQPDGSIRRLKKSTKQKKRTEAMKEAIRLEELARKASSSTGETGSKAYAILSEAAVAAAKGELSEARARELLARLCEVSTGETLRFFTVRSWSAEWLAMKRSTASASTMTRYKTSIDAFLSWIGEKADARLESVTKSDVRSFRDAVRERWTPGTKHTPAAKIDPENCRSAATANLYAADVSAMFRHAMKDGLLLANPCAALPRLTEDDSFEREVFTVAEVGQLVAAAADDAWQSTIFTAKATRADRGEDWQGVILMGFYSGARLGDCVRLTWGNVNLEKKTLAFMPAKTKRKRKRLEIPLHPRLVSWLETRTPGKDDEPLFPVLFKTSVAGKAGLSMQFVAIMEAGKIDRRAVKKPDGRRTQYARSFHSLRHSLTSTLANADVSEEIRRRITGHESAAVHSGYTHHERETLARAVEKMPSV